jgi:hypothetical protein
MSTWPQTALSGGQVVVSGEVPTRCSECGAELTLEMRGNRQGRCRFHAVELRTGTMHGVTPPALATTDWIGRRHLEGEAEAAVSEVERHERALWAALATTEQEERGLKLAVTTLAAVSQRLTGRAAESVRDERLHTVRQRLFEALRRIEAGL